MRKWRERDGLVWGWNLWDLMDYGFRYHRKAIEFITSIASSVIGAVLALYIMR